MNQLFPAFLRLKGAACLVAGGGAVAFRKAKALRECGARVTVVAPRIGEAFLELGQDGALELKTRVFRAEDVAGMRLVIGATDDEAANESVWRACEERGIFCNVVDDPERCSFFAGATVTRGDLKLAISTNGKCPALASGIRKRLERQFGPEYAETIERFGEVREAMRRRHPEDPERRMKILKNLAGSEDLLDALQNRDAKKLEEILDSWTSCSSD